LTGPRRGDHARSSRKAFRQFSACAAGASNRVRREDDPSSILEFPAGAGVANHMRGGHVLVTVLGGEITVREKGTENTFKAGESWTEYTGNVHSVVNAGTAPARVAAVYLVPKGAAVTTIVK
jgi:quercetin dioxygenase-like cupin family protein